MNASNALKRPLKQKNQNIIFTPFTPGELNPSSPKRRYTKSNRLLLDTPSPSPAPSQYGSRPSCPEWALSVREPDAQSPFASLDHVPEADVIIHNVNDYLQSVNMSLWRFLDAIISSRDQQISAIVSRTLSSHGEELLEKISKKRPDVVNKWFEERMERDMDKEGGRLVTELLPQYGETLSSSLESFAMSSTALRIQASAPLLWKCLQAIGRKTDEESSARRDRGLVSNVYGY